MHLKRGIRKVSQFTFREKHQKCGGARGEKIEGEQNINCRVEEKGERGK